LRIRNGKAKRFWQANQIQQLEAQLATAKNTYLKVLGAKEFATSLIKEASPAEDATAEVVPEASGDWDVKGDE